MNAGHVLVCAPRMPEFDRESGSRRIHDLIELFREAGWAVSFAAQQAADGDRYVRLLQQRGVAVYGGFDSRLERMIATARLDLALLAFWHVAEAVMPTVRTWSPGTRVLVDSIDLHFLRNARGTFQRRGGAGAPRVLDQNFGAEMARELNVYAAADGVLTVSQKEADWINDLTGDAGLAHAVPDSEEMPLSRVPLAERKGTLFLGNFWHAPNVGAAEHLCKEIVPLVDADLLARHPVSIVGNAMDDRVRAFGNGLAHVNMVGWVPTVAPYLERARAMVVPLLYGAGTKRKVVQALMVGTPTITTSVGAEGLNVQDGEHLLVADDPCVFARALERLLTEDALCARLTARGRAHVEALHGRETARQRLLQAVELVFQREVKESPPLAAAAAPGGSEAYRQLIQRIQEIVQKVVPAGAGILVVSKGDDRLLALEGRRAGHFPQTDGGAYAGHHPRDAAEAIAHLQSLRAKGAEYLLFPATSAWWLEHYAELRRHLETHGRCVWKQEDCTIYCFAGQASGGADGQLAVPRGSHHPVCPAVMEGRGDFSRTSGGNGAARHVEDASLAAVPPAKNVRQDASAAGPAKPATDRVRPAVCEQAFAAGRNGSAGRKVLVCGIYLADRENAVDDIVAVIQRGRRHQVCQRWVALGGGPPNERVGAVTVREIHGMVPKFQILNELLAAEDLAQYDYVLLTDDDVLLPEGFLDEFIGLQDQLGFALAQPARTNNSYIDHPIVGQQQGVLARQTYFVEIGPVVSFHKSCYDLVFPFDLTAPMGWGYENVWACRLARRNAKMGIIDAVPVDHSLRKPVANYSWAEADRQRKALWARHEHFSLDECFRVLKVIGFPVASGDRI